MMKQFLKYFFIIFGICQIPILLWYWYDKKTVILATASQEYNNKIRSTNNEIYVFYEYTYNNKKHNVGIWITDKIIPSEILVKVNFFTGNFKNIYKETK